MSVFLERLENEMEKNVRKVILSRKCPWTEEDVRKATAMNLDLLANKLIDDYWDEEWLV